MSTQFIHRLKPDPDGLDFNGLRDEGIRLIQQASGEVWTDFNLHDPGVTILEQLCYGLTDLAYRAGFPIPDYLASPKGDIDYRRLGLARPDTAYSSRPVSDDDLRRVLLASIPNLDNVWISRAGGLGGLCHLHLLVAERVKGLETPAGRRAYTDIAHKVYAANRNLCEDLAEVHLVERSPYSLRGEVEIRGDRTPAAILADIHFACAQYLNPPIPIRAYEELHRAGKSLPELFTGPFTRQGYIDPCDLHPWRGRFSMQELTGVINGIEGVKGIRRLTFVDPHGNETDRIDIPPAQAPSLVASLRFPFPAGELGIRLQRAGKQQHAAEEEVHALYTGLLFKRDAAGRRGKATHDWVGTALPTGTFRETGHYHSIQHHFPNLYGINANGVPDSAGAERQAQAMQLKAYLAQFEQVMANFLAQLQNLPELFSLDAHLDRTCFGRVLTNDAVPAIEEVYQFPVPDMERRLAALLAEFDDYGERRNRVLDYLLALYGEEFRQNSLTQFAQVPGALDADRIRNKLAFLRQILDLGRNRSAGCDYLRPEAVETAVPLVKKIRTLLGLRPDEGDILLIEHILLRPQGDIANPDSPVESDFYEFRLSLLLGKEGRFAEAEFRRLAEETIRINCPAHLWPSIHWLSADVMARIRALQTRWFTARTAADTRIDTIATEIVAFLRAAERGEP
jgi:hypothetical protein